MNVKRREDMVGELVIHFPLCPHLIDVPRAQTVFLEEEDHRREGRVPSSRKRFWELSDRREDKDYLGDTQMF